ncbi:hypothetical protein BDW02DRAFT_620079 [Decorospora gaudefroyi]|uniref:RSE1/DDB1/CPSF1 first beta-propeller domain-containing protein n=1 Tax=Decorospora gaudefroyi TaxID=184978 RepID=A0A6A5KUD4_9PLEO|nr:hypothetical protein BDW02DRAFT_620079 [Decorospora gaudefroyi]
MDHQAQVLTLVDGDWVSRPLDPYHVMANAQQHDIEMPDTATGPTYEPPEYGLLSQTIIATPLSKLILPANIRHKDLADIVMVGEDSLHLKEISAYGHLRHVASKTDFTDGRILAAKVFGEPREIPKAKGVGLPLPKNYRKHRPRRPTSADEEHVPPPEVVVLTLSTRTLMFLWARHTHTGTTMFNQATIKLPAGSSRFDRLGTYLAIDPKCRAIAVAAHEGRFILYKTKSMDRWRKDVRESSEPTTPIEDERIIPIKGRIMHMDFLSSGGSQDDYHVVLLFVVVHENRTRLTCFDWDCRQDLSKATARAELVSIPWEDLMPSLLIPLRRSSDFFLVSHSHISVYSNILSGQANAALISIVPRILAPIWPGDSQHSPQWTAWDKTPRNPEFLKEAFYIAREDGRIIYLARGPAGSVEIDEAGVWPNRIDAAFACLSVDNTESSQSYPDVLIAGGASNDGLLCKIGSWPTEYSYGVQYPGTNQFSYVETIPNYTPLTDLSVTQLSTPRAPDERQRSAIFVANGNSPHGEISELRYGIQALVDYSFSGMNGCASIWVVDHGSQMAEIEGTEKRQHYATFAITIPPETLVIRVVRTQPESHADFSGAWEHGTWDVFQTPTDDDPIEDGLLRDEETLSACPWSDEFSIQITRHEARILRRPSLQQVDSLTFGTSLLLASSKSTCPFFAVASRENGNAYVEIVKISGNGTFARMNRFRHELPCDPTCIEILDIDGFPHVLVSTFDSMMLLLRVSSELISTVMTISWKDGASGGLDKLCESAAVLSSAGKHVLVCAMRDGSLLSSQFEVQQNDIVHSNLQFVRMGNTSAKITRSETDPSAAFVSCGSDYCRVRCSTNGPSLLEIDSIWFTDRLHPEYTQSPVSAMYQLPFLPKLDAVGRNLGGFLFAVAGDRLLFSQLDSDVKWPTHDPSSPVPSDSKVVPRKLTTGAKPMKILYMQKLRRVLVATMEAKEERPPPCGYRVLHSSIKLLNVRDDRPITDPEVKQEGEALADRLAIAQCSLLHAERVYSMIEWPFVNHEGKKYSLIIVGTGIRMSPSKQTGRRLIFTTGKNGTKLELQKESNYDDPVYSIALWDNQTTISVVGETLRIDRFNGEAGQWRQLGKTTLHSGGIHISVDQPFVYVSTLQHSHICYRVADAERSPGLDFRQEFTDSRQRECTHHLVVAIPSPHNTPDVDKFVLVTDKKSSSISGLHQPPTQTHRNASATLFEAHLPGRTVIRLARGSIRPPWRCQPTRSSIPGILTDDILGACTDGTIFAFSILSAPARHLLRLLQNLVQVKAARDPRHQHTTVRQQRSNDISRLLMNNAEGNQEGVVRRKDVDPAYLERAQMRGARHKHVDGDLIKRWLEAGEGLEALVRQDADEEVWKLFVELAVGVDGAWGEGSAVENWEAVLCGRVRSWVEDVLMPVL